MNLYKKIYEAVDKGIQKALIIRNDQSYDSSVIWNNKKVTTDFDMLAYNVQCLINGEDTYDDIIQICHINNVKYKVYNDKVLLKTIIDGCVKHNKQCDLNWIDVSDITDMSNMFRNSKFDGDISKWNMSNVTNMSYMFCKSKFNGDIARWDVSNVNDMSHMFQNSVFDGDLSDWDVSNVMNMSDMFRKSVFNNGSISEWSLDSVINMHNMFRESLFNKDISKWNVLNVIDMSGLFAEAAFNKNISGWLIHPNKLENMSEMFAKSSFTGDVADWDVTNVTDMSKLFKNNVMFDSDISKWLVRPNKIKTIYQMFIESAINPDITKWDMTTLKNMGGTFQHSIFNQNISKWNISNVTEFGGAFFNATNFKQNLSDWIIPAKSNPRINIYKMFEYCPIAKKKKYLPQIV